MKYVVIYEKGATGYGAYVPDLPGCVAAGSNLADVKRLIKGAIEMHLEGMQEDGEPIPQPSSRANYAVIGGSFRVSGKKVAKRKLNVRLAESRSAGARRG